MMRIEYFHQVTPPSLCSAGIIEKLGSFCLQSAWSANRSDHYRFEEKLLLGRSESIFYSDEIAGVLSYLHIHL